MQATKNRKQTRRLAVGSNARKFGLRSDQPKQVEMVLFGGGRQALERQGGPLPEATVSRIGPARRQCVVELSGFSRASLIQGKGRWRRRSPLYKRVSHLEILQIFQMRTAPHFLPHRNAARLPVDR